MHDEDAGCHIPGLGCLIGREFVDGGIDEENIGEVIEFGLLDLRLLVDVAVKAQVPALIGPVSVASADCQLELPGMDHTIDRNEATHGTFKT